MLLLKLALSPKRRTDASILLNYPSLKLGLPDACSRRSPSSATFKAAIEGLASSSSGLDKIQRRHSRSAF